MHNGAYIPPRKFDPLGGASTSTETAYRKVGVQKGISVQKINRSYAMNLKIHVDDLHESTISSYSTEAELKAKVNKIIKYWKDSGRSISIEHVIFVRVD